MVATIVNWDKDLVLPLSKKLHIKKNEDGYQAFCDGTYVGDLLSGYYHRNSVKEAINDSDIEKIKVKEFEGTVTGYGEKTGAVPRKTLVVELDQKTNKLLKYEESRKIKEANKVEKEKKHRWYEILLEFIAWYSLPILAILLSLFGIILR
ncbi:MAG: hypothetical protein ACLUJV_02410 [Blautia producta]